MGKPAEKTNLKARCEIREMEIKALPIEDGDNGKMVLEGYAIRFEMPATYKNYGWNGESYTEVVHKGALAKTDMSGVVLRYNHSDQVMVMARTKNNSLQLIPDDQGLLIKAELIDTQTNRDLYQAVKEGLIDKMSFAFIVRDGGDSWTYSKDEIKREINDIEKLYDVSIVDFPFYDSTDVHTRTAEMVDAFQRSLDGNKWVELEKEKIILKGKSHD